MQKKHGFATYYKIILLLASITMLAVCCKTVQPLPAVKSSAPAGISVYNLVPGKPDVAIARSHWPETTLDSLNKGYSIFNVKCTHCHLAKQPQDFSVFAWTGIMHKMGRKAKLDSNQYNLVFRYILTKREAIVGIGK
jgi:hypothetical protein